MHLIDLDVAAICVAVKRQRLNLKRPPVTAEQLLEIFEQQELTQTVAHLINFKTLL